MSVLRMDLKGDLGCLQRGNLKDLRGGTPRDLRDTYGPLGGTLKELKG